jgi:serine acetyltransferase
VQASAVARMKASPFTATAISDFLFREGLHADVAYRAADRLIQKHRASLTFTRGEWRWTGEA